ncbi:transposase [Massilia sp. TS11]|uniref:transposase n=1 Tax=Massilia sp. TS11 TaxID=2908003 RepID=UPI001EDB460F|nr:transposase [Massilia sp. TS11]MCG2586910.1 transposase [Massilia sp. TS11]
MGDNTQMDNEEKLGNEECGHSKEFKLAAVSRLNEGESGSALARELGVQRNQLYKWAREVDKRGVELAFSRPRGRPPLNEENELTRLRRENERLKMENTILKKAEAYFARRKP